MIGALLFLAVLGAIAVFPFWLVWRILSGPARRAKLLAELIVKDQAFRLAKLETHGTEALPHINAFDQLIRNKFDCRPCPRCAELEMFVQQMTPNGRSFEVLCRHCQNKFRWKAVHPDTTDVSNAFRAFAEVLTGTGYRHLVSVPPDKFSAEGGRELIPQGVRQVVWRRDGGRCVQCGAEAHLHFDHIIPVAKGGATTVENLQILCAPCNLSKGARI